MDRRRFLQASGLLGANLFLARGSQAATEPPVPFQGGAVVSPNMNHVPSFVGVEKGIFLRHGLDLKLKVIPSGQAMNKALHAGEVQFASAAISNFPMAVERGLPAIGVEGVLGDATDPYYDENLAVVVRGDSGIRELKELVGKRIGTLVGGTGDQYLRTLFRRRGLPADHLVFLHVSLPNQLATLQAGGVEAICTWEPYVTMILGKLPGARLLFRGGGNFGYFIFSQAARELAERSPAVVERYVRGLAEASQYTRQHLDEAADISTRWISGLDPQIARKAIRFLAYDPRISPHSLQALDESVRALVEQRKLKAPVPRERLVDTRFIEKVLREHPALFSDLKPLR